MTLNEITRVQEYLRLIFSNNRIRIPQPTNPNATVEVNLGDELIGTLHRDDEEGEVSYSLYITILEDDLPPAVSV